MVKDIESILVSEQEIDQIVTDMAKQIENDYKDSTRSLVLVCILKGSFVFAGELMKKLTIPAEIEFMKVSSYGASSVTSGIVNIQLDITRHNLEDCDLLIVEDIIDSGKTLERLVKHFEARGVGSVRTCTLLDKPSRRMVEFEPDYRGKIIPDKFVVGFGLDYGEKYRNLPYVGVLKAEVYS